MNTHHAFQFQDQTLWALPQGALWWPAQRLMCVSDLHLGKSDRVARRTGRMLPPYETRATLDRLMQIVDIYDPMTLISLGDSFDDLDAANSLTPTETADIARMQAGRKWIWIEGNHDPGPVQIGGEHRFEFKSQSLTFRHIAEIGATGEISGHYHPKCRLQRGGSRAAFLSDVNKIILPAFGSYTGGLNAKSPILTALLDSNATAILTGRKAMAVPLQATQ